MQSINSINSASLLKNIGQANSISGLSATGNVGGADGGSFKSYLIDSINEVNTMQQDAAQAVEGLATGADVNPAEVLTAVQKADIAFRMMIQVRNKMVQAYEEIKSIRV